MGELAATMIKSNSLYDLYLASKREFFWLSLGYLFIGILVTILVFPSAFRKYAFPITGTEGTLLRVAESYNNLQLKIAGIIGPEAHTTLRKLVTSSVLGFIFMIGLLKIFSFRQKDWKYLTFGFGGIIIGFFAIHAGSWILDPFLLLNEAIPVFKTYCRDALAGGERFLEQNSALIVLIAAAGLGIWRFKRWRLKIIIALAAVTVVAVGLKVVIPSAGTAMTAGFKAWLNFLSSVSSAYFWPAIGYTVWLISRVFLFILTVFGVGLFFNWLGKIIIDQYQAAWRVSEGPKLALMGGIAVGLAWSLVFFITFAHKPLAEDLNGSWAGVWNWLHAKTWQNPITGFLLQADIADAYHYLLAPSAKAFAAKLLLSVTGAVCGATMLVSILGVGVLSLLLRVFPGLSEEDVGFELRFLPKEYVVLVFGFFASVFHLLYRLIKRDTE